ncbi:keratin-associated protein 4-8-like isoform X1 [Tribolium madens]|uniref:keratin-associated protein 4-8-like isoform X1 n=1 Tax=Tribolium madens TaxID=41895 RepID=UPI001CF76552|nr:keratin-associated protein 4-8-like isoform X1 [Tribolium madens]
MSCCARCGQGICSTAGKIALNKVWHKSCFCCYNCNRPLNLCSAKIYYGEVFCACCCPTKEVCRVNSTPSFNYCERMRPVCCKSSESDDCCRPRDIHSCSCIPSCCSPCPCQTCCEDRCFKRIHCRPRSPKPLNYPPRPPKCSCNKCCPPPRRCPRKNPPCRPPPRCPSPCPPRCPSPCPPPRCPSPCPPSNCCDGKNKMIYFRPRCPSPSCGRRSCKPRPCNTCNRCCSCDDRCKRCGEKVFAAEKVLTSHGSYHLGCFSCYCCCKSLCVKTMYEACGEIYCRQCYNNYFGISSYGYCGNVC